MSLKRSKQQPVIIVMEDLHWIDQSSEDFCLALVESLASSAILLLTTYRPGYQPPWIGKSYVTQIALPRLTPADSLTVVHSIGQQDALPQSMARTILEKADGNPLFLEELTRVIVTQGGLRPDTTVPDTLQGVLMARLDRLPDASKRLLQTAAILGRTFSASLLQAIWDEPADLDAGLRELKRFEFLYEEHDTAESLYVFKHALTQEVAYDSLLASRRRRYMPPPHVPWSRPTARASRTPMTAWRTTTPGLNTPRRRWNISRALPRRLPGNTPMWKPSWLSKAPWRMANGCQPSPRASGCSSICTCGWRCPWRPWDATRRRNIACASSRTVWSSSTTPG